MDIIQLLDIEEGFSNTPYLCSSGYVTIGNGTVLYKVKNADPSLFPIKVTKEQARIWMVGELNVKLDRLRKSYFGITFDSLPSDINTVILSMAYQLGVNGLLNFKRMIIALGNGDMHLAAIEALDSVWASSQQTPRRASRHARVINGESLKKVYKRYLK